MAYDVFDARSGLLCQMISHGDGTLAGIKIIDAVPLIVIGTVILFTENQPASIDKHDSTDMINHYNMFCNGIENGFEKIMGLGHLPCLVFRNIIILNVALSVTLSAAFFQQIPAQ
jgi:hypothetical protein